MLHFAKKTPLLSALLKRALLSALVCGGALSFSAPALACGGFFCTTVPIDQAGERIFFAKDGEDMVAHVQIQYTGAAEDFSWIVPVPSVPDLGVGSDQLFTQLRNATRPTFSLINRGTLGDCKVEPVEDDYDLYEEAAEEPQEEPEEEPQPEPSAGVEVLQEEAVGPFDSVVIRSEDPNALKDWLRDNGYQIPDNVDPKLDPYVKEGFNFLALKLRKESDTGDLQPITMRYKSENAMIPIQLTAVAATPDMDVYVWLLGNGRAVPTNYRHVEINPLRVAWNQNGFNYRQLVIDAVDEAGSRAFVTDYAGTNTEMVDLSVFTTGNLNIGNLREATGPGLFIEMAQALNLFPDVEAQQAFIRRYVPKPESLASIDDNFFYSNLNQFIDILREEGIKIEAQAAADELEERFVEPYSEIRRLFNAHPYLSALYTTLSPEEMTVDPSFSFSTQLADVPNQRSANIHRICNPDIFVSEAPYHVSFANYEGLKYETESFGGTLDEGPMALRAVQYAASGDEDVIFDNQSKLATMAKATLKTEPRNMEGVAVTAPSPVATQEEAAEADANASADASPSPDDAFDEEVGTGCTCSSPTSPPPDLAKGAGEGLTYMLMGLGFLGWRRRRKFK